MRDLSRIPCCRCGAAELSVVRGTPTGHAILCRVPHSPLRFLTVCEMRVRVCDVTCIPDVKPRETAATPHPPFSVNGRCRVSLRTAAHGDFSYVKTGILATVKLANSSVQDGPFASTAQSWTCPGPLSRWFVSGNACHLATVLCRCCSFRYRRAWRSSLQVPLVQVPPPSTRHAPGHQCKQ